MSEKLLLAIVGSAFALGIAYVVLCALLVIQERVESGLYLIAPM